MQNYWTSHGISIINCTLFQFCAGMYSSRFSCTVPVLFLIVRQTDCFVVLSVSQIILLFLFCHFVSFNNKLWEIQFKKSQKKRGNHPSSNDTPRPPFTGTTKPYELCEVKILNVCML